MGERYLNISQSLRNDSHRNHCYYLHLNVIRVVWLFECTGHYLCTVNYINYVRSHYNNVKNYYPVYFVKSPQRRHYI